MRPWRFIAVVGIMFGVAVNAAQVGLIKINGAIGPASASYIARAVGIAAEQHDECLIIQLDTPGGLVDSASQIVEKFYAAKVPTVVYVSPAPARAGSAGVFITMAADVAVMAPHTRIGAAHPVELGASGDVAKTDDVMKKKMENDTASFAQSIAEKRNRNVDWAKAAVLESASITEEVIKKKRKTAAPGSPHPIAKKRNRNVDGARAAVLESASITAEEALDKN